MISEPSYGRRIAALLLVVLTTCGCSKSEPKNASRPPDFSTSQPSTESPATQPISSVASNTERSSRPRFEARRGWHIEEPSRPNREHQYRLPKATGDQEDAQLVIETLGQGTRADRVLKQWADDLRADEAVSASKPIERRIGPFAVSTLELRGTYRARVSPRSAERFEKTGWSLVGAVINSAEGLIVVQLLGPSSTVEKWRADFDALIDGIAD